MGHPLRVAIVGAGGIARRHARACREVEATELVAVCDVLPAAAERFANEFGVTRHYAGLDAMVAAESIDIAIVATWGDSHAAVTDQLARSGRVRAILCEKPFSRTAAEAVAMAEAAASAGVLLVEAFKFRYHPLHQRAADLIAAGRLGRVTHIHSTFSTAMPAAARDPDHNWRYNAARGGGAIYDLACYCVHHARWVMESEPIAVQATGRWDTTTGIDEVVAATLDFGGGRTAQWWVSFVDSPSQVVEIIGSQGQIVMDRAWNNEDQSTALEVIQNDGQRERYECAPVFQFALQLQHLVDCLMTGRAPLIPPAASIAQMRVLDALHQALRDGETVRL